MKKIIVVVLTSLSALMSGCEDHVADTQQKIDAIDQNVNTKIVPLPEFGATELVVYLVSSLRNPFIPSSVFSELQNYRSTKVYVNPNRKKHPLESYDLETLSMVGVVSKGNGLSALIQTSDKDLIIVGKGAYLGLNQGRVTNVSSKGIDLIEIIPDGLGGFRQRARTMLAIENDAPAS